MVAGIGNIQTEISCYQCAYGDIFKANGVGGKKTLENQIFMIPKNNSNLP